MVSSNHPNTNTFNPQVNWVPTFKGDKFEQWSIQMKSIFITQDVWKIIQDGYEIPSDAKEEASWDETKTCQYNQNKRRDHYALSIIYRGLDETMLPTIMIATTAKEAWSILETKYRSSEKLQMKKEIYNAAITGDVEFLAGCCAAINDIEAAVAAAYSDEDILGLTSHGNNIIHVAAKNGHLDFIKSVLENLSLSTTDKQSLIEGSNNDGDTPLHFAAKLPTKSVAEQLISSYYPQQQLLLISSHDNDQIATTTTTTTTTSWSKLWQIKNKRGNTPLHVALMNGGKSLQVATYLLGVGPEVASYTNHCKETPLHLAVHYDNEGSKKSMTNMVNKLNGLGASLDYTKCHFEEDSLSVIKRLLEINTAVCCLQDENGMTPLLRATCNSYFLGVIAIIEFCPECVEICDPKGRTMLHHINKFIDPMLFLKSPKICSLMDQQDEDGNTPLHIAMANCDYNMVKALMNCNANFVIKNMEGISAATLIQSESSSFLDKVKYDIKRAVTDNYDEVMTKELYEAAYNGDWELLINRLEDPDSERHFLTRLPNGSNIIHVVMEGLPDDYWKQFNYKIEHNYESPPESFIVEALKKFPILSCQTNNNGETPLHLAMYKGLLQPGGITFEFIKDHLKQIKDQMSSFPLPPWKAKDADGDTLLHQAVRRFSSHKFAEYLIELDPKLVGDVNNHNQTPLHRLCQGFGINDPMAEQEENDMVDLLLEKDATVVYSYDADGFTPLLRAAHTGRLKIAARIVHHFPQSIKQFDSHFGRNIFHLIDMDPDDKEMAKLFSKVPQMRHLVTRSDDNFNTPLHVAIEQQRFGTAKFLMVHFGNEEVPYILLNNDGKTVGKMLADAQNGPRWFQDFLSSQWFHLPIYTVTGKGAYGVHVSYMRDYMSVIGIVAALLTTITFTAAFTVPGGYDQDIGTPIMARKAAFQVFMVTDVVGMCSSMMTLFCLLWFLNSGQVEREGSRLVDVSMMLLQLSFYATLIAFMSGVYATISPDVQWMAIFTCTLCSISLLLMRKRFILDVVAKGFFILYLFSKVFSTFLKELCCGIIQQGRQRLKKIKHNKKEARPDFSQLS